ncbi:Mariner transposase [Oopsacas minuta]|uniref:Mariner transposase n=1 Tax=Oopsacas minuta TaxID=111878 RepID=A0AAV7KF14_9METZ|nr:Mariner transposase [Oopsacas minuta]
MLKKFKGGESKRVYDILTCDEDMDLSVRSGNKAAIFNLGVSWLRSTCQSSWARSVEKKMVAAFFCKTGPVAIIPLEYRRTVNADWYINNCLPKAFEA